MPGILNYKRYLETLQTITELGNTFPSNQTTYTFNIGGSGVDGWTATINWTTLVIDQYTENANQVPDFNQSQVLGYYTGGTTSQYTTGVLSLPSQMYSGPILPASLTNLPITVVTINWLKDGTTYDVNLALIQNWEPGVTIASPTTGIDFEPIEPLTSTLTLSGPSQQFYGLTATFTAESDIPISLGSPNYCYLYRGIDTLVATEIFIDHTATFNINTLNTGTYTLYAKFGGIGDYGTVVSNTLSFEVISGIPLILSTQTFTPSQAYYLPGQSTEYTIAVIPDPSFPPTGFAVTTTNRIDLVTQVGSTLTNFYLDRFYNGQSTATITANSSMVDIGITNTLTAYSITSYSTSTNLYTATIFVINTNTLITSWDYQYDAKYLSGSNSTTFSVATSTQRTLNINDFPIIISQSTSRAIVNSPLAITVQTTSSGYSLPIEILAKLASSSTYTTVYSQNHSGLSQFTATIQLAQTGTYSIYASYSGDIGQSIYWANRASTSNSVTHVATPGRDLVPVPIFTITRQGDVYTFLVTANTATTLTNAVSFYDGVDFRGSATWVRTFLATSSTNVIQPQLEYYAAMPGVIHRVNTYTGVLTVQAAPGTSINTVSSISYVGEYTDQFQSATGKTTYSYTRNSQPATQYWPNYLTTFERTTATQSLLTWYNLYGYRYNYTQRNLYISYGEGDFKLAPIFGDDPSTAVNVNEFYNAVANTRLQDRSRISNDGEINPNIWRLWRYYDGTNYNLSTSTAFLDLLDPINQGLWQSDFLQSYNFTSGGDVLVDHASERRNFALNSRVYQYDQQTDYGWDMYDVYRMDYIGDNRGYNVIGLNADMTASRPMPSPGNPIRLYFSANGASFLNTAFNNFDSNTYYIDLVEYIGQLSKTNPIRNSTEYAAGSPSTTSTIWLFRFTPEVRASDNLHKTTMPLQERLNYLPSNTYQGNGRVNRIAMTHDGIFRMPDGATRFAGQFVKSEIFWQASQNDNQFYGRKQWITRNINDPAENAYTAFCNAWFSCFGMALESSRANISSVNKNYLYDYRRLHYQGVVQNLYPNLGRIFTAETFSTATIYTPTNTQTATFTTTVALIETSTKIALWPGTVGLGEFYGEFNGFELRIDPQDIDRFQTIKDVGTSTVIITTSTVSRFGTVTLNYQNPTASGSVTFLNQTNGTVIGTSTVVQGVANLTTSGYVLSNTTTSQLVSLRADYTSSVSTLTNSSATTITVIGNNQTAFRYDFSTLSDNGSWRTIATISNIGPGGIYNLGRYGGTVNLTLPGFTDVEPGTKNVKIYLATQAYYTATKSQPPFTPPTPVNSWVGSAASVSEYTLPNLSPQDTIPLTINYTIQNPGPNDITLFNINIYLVKLNLIIMVNDQVLYTPNQGKLFGVTATLALV